MRCSPQARWAGWARWERAFDLPPAEVARKLLGSPQRLFNATARRIVLERLRQDSSWNQFDYNWDERHQSVVTFDPNRPRDRFIVLASEVMWQLVAQGVITPGESASNPSLPWFRVTSYGKEVLESGKFPPHDPTGYLEELRSLASKVTDDVAIGYLEEGLRCFNSGCNVAAVLLLGVAAESVFRGLCTVVSTSLKSAKEKQVAAPIMSLADALREGGNLGAHFDLEREPTKEVAEEMLDLLDDFIEYLFLLPHKIEELKNRIDAASVGDDA